MSGFFRQNRPSILRQNSPAATTYFQALGRAKLAGFLVVFRQLALVVPMVLLLPDLMGGNVLGVWLALPLNDVNHPCGCGCLAYA